MIKNLMIYQELIRILEIYFTGIDMFYRNVDKYFLEKIKRFLGNNVDNIDKVLEDIILILIDEFVELGLYKAKVQNRFFDKFLTVRIEENSISSIDTLYEKKIAPLVYEVILEQVIFYLIDDRGIPIILCFKNKGFLTLDFVIELRNLKNLLNESPVKLDKLKKYFQIRDKIIIKFCENKEKIESLEDLDDLETKIQLFYQIYKIIDFFDINYIFDFSHMKCFLQDHFEDCMESIPLISLKNPDIYYCALYLANELKVNFNHKKIKVFLQDLYKDLLDDFDVPILEATNQISFYLQSTSLVKLWLEDEQIKNLVKFDSHMFDPYYLKNMETSQLGNILAIFAFLNSLNKDELIIEAINDEIEKRITPNKVLQYRNGFYSSEASYYVIFSNYINNNYDKLKSLLNPNILDKIVSRIYRNLEFLEFSGDMNIDLLSELFYSIESLRLFNCIKIKEFTMLLTKYMFPETIERKISRTIGINGSKTRSKYLTIDKITGESYYMITS
ncbi:MAG: hypothetical protein ACFFA2_07300 [Promethearchaeota archaeon]